MNRALRPLDLGKARDALQDAVAACGGKWRHIVFHGNIPEHEQMDTPKGRLVLLSRAKVGAQQAGIDITGLIQKGPDQACQLADLIEQQCNVRMGMSAWTGERLKVAKKPFHGGQQCARCNDTKVVGLCDMGGTTPELRPACKRHVDKTIECYKACVYCDGPVRKGCLLIEGQYAHKSCHAMDENDTFDETMRRRADERSARARRKKAPTSKAAEAALDNSVNTEEGPVRIVDCSSKVLKGEYPFTTPAKAELIKGELARRGWRPSAKTTGPIVWTLEP